MDLREKEIQDSEERKKNAAIKGDGGTFPLAV